MLRGYARDNRLDIDTTAVPVHRLAKICTGGPMQGKMAAPPIAPAAAAILKATKIRRALMMPAVILVAGGVAVGILDDDDV